MTLLTPVARTDQPVRAAAVLRCIEAAADAPQDVAGIAAELGLHPNTVRKHLANLLRAGLIEQHRGGSGRRGRPRHLYRAAPRPVPAYEQLAVMLLDLHRTGADARSIGRARGWEAGAGAADAIAAVATVAAANDLRPRVDGIDVVIAACPFESALGIDDATVCSLHLGFLEGAAAAHGACVAMVRDDRGCRFRVDARGS